MKSFLSLVFVLLVFITVFGGGGLLFYLSYTTEFARKDKPSAAVPGMTPAAPSQKPAASR